MTNRFWDSDVVYMRWMQNGNPFRVTKMTGGIYIALYTLHDDKNKFSFEAFKKVDDPGMKFKGVRRKAVKDEILLRLLDGEETSAILRNYQPTPLGEDRAGDPGYSYYLAKADSEEYDMDYFRHGTFHISEDLEERAAAMDA